VRSARGTIWLCLLHKSNAMTSTKDQTKSCDEKPASAETIDWTKCRCVRISILRLSLAVSSRTSMLVVTTPPQIKNLYLLYLHWSTSTTLFTAIGRVAAHIKRSTSTYTTTSTLSTTYLITYYGCIIGLAPFIAIESSKFTFKKIKKKDKKLSTETVKKGLES